MNVLYKYFLVVASRRPAHALLLDQDSCGVRVRVPRIRAMGERKRK